MTKTVRPLLVVAAGIGSILWLPAGPADGAEAYRYKRKVESSTETVIGIGTRWNKKCKSIGVPQVVLDAAPEQGFVCIRIGLVKPQGLLFGNAAQCLNTPMTGVQIVYRSRAGYAGPDAVSYTLKFPRGERPYSVELDVADRITRPPSGPSMLERQTPGPMPECAALVS